MNGTTQTITTSYLEDGQLLILDARSRSRVRVLGGAVWLTEEDDTDDMLLCAGARHALGHGRALVEARGRARVQVTVDEAGAMDRIASGLELAFHAARLWTSRLQLGPVAHPPPG